MTELTLKGEQYRIRRLDPRNLVIEKLKGQKNPTWDVIGYYGRISDLTIGLLNRVVELPQADTLIEQIALLRVELKATSEAIEAQLKVAVEV